MKGLKKLTLASAIAAAPFATQALEALDDATMGDVTGQAGVTVEISVGDAGITVGEISYTDTASTNLTTGDRFAEDGTTPEFDGGSVVIQDLKISGINQLTQTIDVTSNGDLLLGMTGADALVQKTFNADGDVVNKTYDAVAAGDLSSETLLTTPVDSAAVTADEAAAENTARAAAISAGNGVANISISLAGTAEASAMMLQSADGSKQAELINNLNLSVDLGDSVTTVHNLAGEKLSTIQVGGDYADTTAAMAISASASFRINDMDLGVFGYTQAQATAQATTLSTALNSGDADTEASAMARANEAIASYNAGVDAGSAVDLVVDGDSSLTADQQAAVAGAVANGSAIQITDLSFLGADGGMVKADQVIWAQGGSSANGGGVYIQLGSIQGDMNIGSIAIGGSSIGSVSVSDINLAGMTQRIYGH